MHIICFTYIKLQFAVKLALFYYSINDHITCICAHILLDSKHTNCLCAFAFSARVQNHIAADAKQTQVLSLLDRECNTRLGLLDLLSLSRK